VVIRRILNTDSIEDRTMSDTKLLNWVHNRQVDITWRNNKCTVTVYDADNMPMIEETGITVRNTLNEAYKAYQRMKAFC
jgi:hypothetical protein